MTKMTPLTMIKLGQAPFTVDGEATAVMMMNINANIPIVETLSRAQAATMETNVETNVHVASAASAVSAPAKMRSMSFTSKAH
jgi:hypothetical protein